MYEISPMYYTNSLNQISLWTFWSKVRIFNKVYFISVIAQIAQLSLFIPTWFLAPLLLLELLSHWHSSNGHSSVPISGSACV